MPGCPKWSLPEVKMEWEKLCVKLSEMGVLVEVVNTIIMSDE